jgi:hypothetical protein
VGAGIFTATVWPSAGPVSDEIAEAHRSHLTTLERSPRWTALVAEIGDRVTGPPQTIRLVPTEHSRLS